MVDAAPSIESDDNDDSGQDGRFAKSSMREISKALEAEVTSDIYRAAMGEYRVRNIRLQRQMADNQRRTSTAIERHFIQSEVLLTRLRTAFYAVAALLAVNSVIGIVALIRSW